MIAIKTIINIDYDKISELKEEEEEEGTDKEEEMEND